MPAAQLMTGKDVAPQSPALRVHLEHERAKPRTPEREYLIALMESVLALREDRRWLTDRLNKALMRRKG